MAGFERPNIGNAILEDVPAINEALNALGKLDPSQATQPAQQMKRVSEGADGYEFQQYNGATWTRMDAWNLDAKKAGGYAVSAQVAANTIPVRNADGDLTGDITGNAHTATTAEALSAVNPVSMGGTGATTAADARNNLEVPPKNHASTEATYGTGTKTAYGHVKLSDDTNSDHIDGVAPSLKAVKDVKAIADAALPKAGGNVTGSLTVGGKYAVTSVEGVTAGADGNVDLPWVDHITEGGSEGLVLGSMQNPMAYIGVEKNSELAAVGLCVGNELFRATSTGTLQWSGKNLVRSVNGTYADASGNIEIQAGGGLPVGSITWYSGASIPDGYLICNGSAVSRTAFPDLFNAIGTAYGIGDGTTTFNLPNLINRYARGGETAGALVEAGLPNITGTLFTNDTYEFFSPPTESGAITKTMKTGQKAFSRSGTVESASTVGFDASQSNPIYGASDTVTPPSVTLVPIIKAYEAQVNTGTVDVGALIESMGAYLPITGGNITGDLTVNNVPVATTERYITEAYHTDTEFYRKYSDGWIEQGAYIAITGRNFESAYTLVTPFASANYFIYAASTYSGRAASVEIKSASTFGISNAVQNNSTGTAGNAFYYACGFGATS